MQGIKSRPQSSVKFKLPKIDLIEQPVRSQLLSKTIKIRNQTQAINTKTQDKKRSKSCIDIQNPVERNQLKRSQKLADSGTFLDRVSSGKWDSRIQKDEHEIKTHLVDNPDNMQSTYKLTQEPLNRLKELSYSLQTIIQEGTKDDFLFGGMNKNEDPILKLDEFIPLRQLKQVIGDGQEQTDHNIQKREDNICQSPDATKRIKEKGIVNFQDTEVIIPVSIPNNELGINDLEQHEQKEQQDNKTNQKKQPDIQEDTIATQYVVDVIPLSVMYKSPQQTHIDPQQIQNYLQNTGFQIISEGQAVSELEIYGMVFDQLIMYLQRYLCYNQQFRSVNNNKDISQQNTSHYELTSFQESLQFKQLQAEMQQQGPNTSLNSYNTEISNVYINQQQSRQTQDNSIICAQDYIPSQNVNESIINTFIQTKNYFINKAIRKSQLEKGLQDAVQQLDLRCQIAESDFKIAQQRLEDQIQKYDQLLKEHGDLKDKFIKLEIDLQHTQKEKIKLEGKVAQLQAANYRLDSELRDQKHLNIQLEKKLKNYYQVIQRQQNQIEQVQHKLHYSDQVSSQQAETIIKLEKMNTALKDDIEKLKRQIIFYRQKQDEATNAMSTENTLLRSKLYKYGESLEGSGHILAQDVREALKYFVYLKNDTTHDQEHLTNLIRIYQRMNEASTAHEMLEAFTGVQQDILSTNSQSVQVNTIVVSSGANQPIQIIENNEKDKQKHPHDKNKYGRPNNQKSQINNIYYNNNTPKNPRNSLVTPPNQKFKPIKQKGDEPIDYKKAFEDTTVYGLLSQDHRDLINWILDNISDSDLKDQLLRELQELEDDPIALQAFIKKLEYLRQYKDKDKLQAELWNILQQLQDDRYNQQCDDSYMCNDNSNIQDSHNDNLNSRSLNIGIQVYISQNEIEFYKSKIKELIAFCEANGLQPPFTLDEIQNQLGDINLDVDPTELFKNGKLQHINPKDKKYVNTINRHKLPNIVKLDNPEDVAKRININNKSFDVNSFVHEQNTDPELTKYVKTLCSIKEVQATVDVSNKQIQTEPFEELAVRFINEKGEEETLNLDDINNLNGDMDDNLQRMPLFGDSLTDMREYIAKQIHLYNQNKKALQAKNDAFNEMKSDVQQQTTYLQLTTEDESNYQKFLQQYGTKSSKSMHLLQNQPLTQRTGLGSIVTGMHFQLSSEQQYQVNNEYRIGDIAKKVLESQSSLIIKNQFKIPTFQEYTAIIHQVTMQQLVHKIKKSTVLIHPRYGNLSLLQLTSPGDILDAECFQIIHFIDKIYYKYNPVTIQKNQPPVLYPCVIKQISNKKLLEIDSQEQQDTLNQFKQEVAQYQLNFSGNSTDSEITSLKKQKQVGVKKPNSKNDSDDEEDDVDQKLLKQFKHSLLPSNNDKIGYVRIQSCTVGYKIPQVFRDLERYNAATINIIEFGSSTYIKVPMENVILKSLTWVVKLARTIIQTRIQSTESFIVSSDQISSEDQRSTFQVSKGQILRDCSESLHKFAIKWAQDKYGSISLVNCIMWNLITNLVYYQYQNEEVYLFARFFFGDLPIDLYLTYLEAYSCCEVKFGLNEAIINKILIPLQDIPLILHSLLTNWEPKRKYTLAQHIYAIWISQQEQGKLNKASENALTIEFTQLLQILLYAIYNFRRPVYQTAKLVFTKLYQIQVQGSSSKTQMTNYPDEIYLNINGFRQYSQMLMPMWSQRSSDEFFYAFSQTTMPKSQNLEYRFMTLENFNDLFCSAQLCRFSKISSEIMMEVSDNSLKRLMLQYLKTYKQSRVSINQLLDVVSRYTITNGAKQVQQNYKNIRREMDNLQCDIMSYDALGAAATNKRLIGEVLDILALIKPTGCCLIIGAFMNALLEVTAGSYSDGKETIKDNL